jgi:molecular chaperone GrpE
MSDMNGQDDYEPETGGAEVEEDAAIGVLRAEIASLKDQALRYAAEAENTKRRAEREVNDARAYAITKFAKDLLGVADNLSRALEHAPKDAGDTPAGQLAVGLEMTEKALLTAFERNGLKRIHPATGEKFDPHQQQAMMEQTSVAFGPGAVVQVLQSGYDLFGRNLRPAMVVVAAKDSTGRAANASDPAAGEIELEDAAPPLGAS